MRAILIFVMIFSWASAIHAAEGPQQVQKFTDHLQPGESHYYNVPNLKKGDTLYVYVQRISGNLDPIVGVTKDRVDFSCFGEC